MSYLSSWGRSLSVSALITAGAIGGLVAGVDISGNPLVNHATQMQLMEPNQPRSQSDSGLGLLLAIAVVGGVGATVYRGRNRSHSFESKGKHYHLDQATSPNQLSQLNGTLQHKLLRQLHGDRAAANRLLVHTKLKYPDRSMSWCAEKVIYDLERDRSRA